MDNIKKAAAEATSFFNRAKQVNFKIIFVFLKYDIIIKYFSLVYWRKTWRSRQNQLRCKFRDFNSTFGHD
jgi:hypothetical protein